MRRYENLEETELPQVILTDPDGGMQETIIRFGTAVRTICKNILVGFGSAEAEDAVSECFAAIWQAAGRFDETEGASFRSYCYGVARFTALGRRRQLTAKPVIPLDEQLFPEGEDEVLRHEEEQLLHEAVDAMGEPERTVFLLRYFYFFRVKEIARRTGLSAKKVENLLARKKKELAKLMEERGICP